MAHWASAVSGRIANTSAVAEETCWTRYAIDDATTRIQRIVGKCRALETHAVAGAVSARLAWDRNSRAVNASVARRARTAIQRTRCTQSGAEGAIGAWRWVYTACWTVVTRWTRPAVGSWNTVGGLWIRHGHRRYASIAGGTRTRDETTCAVHTRRAPDALVAAR